MNTIISAAKARGHWNKKQPRTHCRKGHEFTIENTYITKSGYLVCRVCNKDTNEKSRLKRKKYKQQQGSFI